MTHRTDSGNHCVDIFGVSIIVRQPLTEKEIEFGVIGISSIWYEVGVDEIWLWMKSCRLLNKSINNRKHLCNLAAYGEYVKVETKKKKHNYKVMTLLDISEHVQNSGRWQWFSQVLFSSL